MKSYTHSRRIFLGSVGAAAGLVGLLDRLEAQEEGDPPIRRLLTVQRPVGTIWDNWWPTGNGSDLTSYSLGRIMEPFEDFKDKMVIFRGIGLPHKGSAGGGHERGTVLTVTGRRAPNLYPGNGGDDPYAEGPSVDQLYLEASPILQDAPIKSLQLSCDQRADTPGEVSPRHMSYSGAHAPMKPYYQPLETYERVFGTVMPGGVTDENLAALAQARAQKQSVLDFARKDLTRMRTVAPAAQREKLDAYETAIRDLEAELDSLDADTSDPAFCGAGEAPEVVEVSQRVDPYFQGNVSPERDDEKHRRIGEMHLAIVKAAFKCDLTRTVTFQWSPGTNHVSFGNMWPPDEAIFKVHHTTSHNTPDDNIREFLTRIDQWYSQRLATFLTELQETEDISGHPILDNTLVPYISEISEGFSHSWRDMPWVVFGGAGTGLIGGQMWRHDGSTPSGATDNGQRSTNDYWMACAQAFGIQDFVLGDNEDMHSTAIEGIFAG